MGTYTGQDKRLQYLFQNGGGGGGGTDVEANPQGTPTAYLNTVKIANSIYSVEKPADIYSTEERQVGVFSDGKPLYQKTVNVGALPNNTTKNTAHNISNIDIVVNAFGFAKSTANHTPIPFVNNTTIGSQVALIVDNTNITLRTNDNRSNYSGYVTLQYTKTTDVAGSGIWTPSGTYAHHYSISEQIIGTWYDGSTLYEKTLEIPFSSFSSIQSGSRYTYGFKQANEDVKNIIGYADSSSYGHCFFGTRNYTQNNSMTVYWEFVSYYGALNLSFVNITATTVRVDKVYITYQYTKTS